jgi:hypothetical protein
LIRDSEHCNHEGAALASKGSITAHNEPSGGRCYSEKENGGNRNGAEGLFCPESGQEHTNQVDVKNAFPFLGVELFERLEAAEIPGVVHKDVDARRLTDQVRESLCDLVGTRNIDLTGLRTLKLDRIDIPNPDLSAGRTNCAATALPIPRAPPVTMAV